MFKKPLSLILALLMILSAFAASPLTAFAEDTAAETDAHEEITDLKTVDRSADRDIAAVGSDLIDSDYPDYEYVLLDDGTAKITFFQTMFMPSEIRVPETLGGHQVTETGTLIFRFYKEISKIILPKGLKTIGRYTSSGCTNLTEIVIPDTVTSIGEGAFYGSPKLTSVDIPASVTEIGPLAFGYYWDSASETDAKISKLTIRGKKGTAAEKYAKDNGFAFTALPSSGVTVSGSITSYLSDTDNITVELIGVDSVTVNGNTASYSIYDVAPGTYTLRVTKNDHVTCDKKITVKDKDVTQDVKICPKGDVNADGETDIMDCSLAQRYIRELTPLDNYQIRCGDVSGTGDGELDIQDVSRILRHIRELAMLY